MENDFAVEDLEAAGFFESVVTIFFIFFCLEETQSNKVKIKNMMKKINEIALAS